MKIKNIIFDLGGVIINLKRENAVKALEKLGVKNISQLLGEYSQKGAFLQLETGEISSAEFYDMLLSKCNAGTSCKDIRDAFEKFLVDIPLERLKMLDHLKAKGYKLYVLSNTNPIMYNHWIDREFRKDGKSINDYFDGIVTSFQENTCKPDEKIFQNLVRRYNLIPEETLMLDDSEANLKSAGKVGLHTNIIHPQGENALEEVIKGLL